MVRHPRIGVWLVAETIENKLAERWVKDDSFVPIATIPKVQEIELMSMQPDEDILKEYPYIAGDWKKGDTVACQTYKATPIKWIYTIEDGEVKWYDARWNRIEAPFKI